MLFDGIQDVATVRVVLHGRLRRKFGPERNLGVRNAAEAFRALALLQPGFREAISEGEYRVVRGRLKDGVDLEPISLGLRLAPGQELHIVPVPKGGGGRGGKAILGTVIMVAAVAMAPWTGGTSFAAAMAAPALGGLTTYGGIFMMGAAMFLSGMSQLLSPQPKTPTRQNANDERSYLLSGLPNVVEQGAPVPLVYGRVRVGSVVASIGYSAEEYNPAPEPQPGAPEPESSEPPGVFEAATVEHVVEGGGAGGGGGAKGGGGGGHVAREDPNNLRSRAVVRIIDVLSEGPIEGLVDGAKSIFFNNTPLQASDDTWNFKGVTWEVRTGLPDQDPVAGYPAAETSVGVAQQVKVSSGPVTRTITSATATSVRVTVRIPALYKNTSQGDLIAGPNVAYTFMVRPVGGAWTTVVDELITGGKCTSPYERSYRFTLPTSGTNSWEVRMTRISDDSSSVTEASDTWWAAYDVITDHQLIYPNTAYIALTFDAEAFGAQLPQRSYDIKGIQCMVPTNYDPVAKTYATTGPGTSGGTWDGASWKLAWTDNNAWVLYDLLSSSRYGGGLSATALSLAKWDLYTIGQYCDGIVSDGFGGTERRYTMNTSVMDQEDAYRLLQKFVASFRGMIYWAAGSMAVSADMPTTPVKVLSQANVIDGVFNYETTSLASRHTAARVAWRDPNDAYGAAVEMVESYTDTFLPGQRVADVVGFGVTSRGLAHRLGRWLIDTEQRTPETVTTQVSIDNMDIRPGDVVKVADRYYAGIRMGGRLLAGSTTTLLYLDAPFTPVVGQTYSISVILPDGTLVNDRAISAWGTSGGNATVTVSALAQAPAAGASFLITSTALVPRQFRVAGIMETEKNIFTVVGLQYDPNKFARVEDGVSLPAEVFSDLQNRLTEPLPLLGVRGYAVSTSGGSATLTGVDTVGLEVGMLVANTEPYPYPTEIVSIDAGAGTVVLSQNRTGTGAFTGEVKFFVVTARSYLTGVGNTTIVRTTVSWYQPTDIRVDHVEVRVSTATTIIGFYSCAGASIDIDNLPPDTYAFSVRPASRDGRVGSWIPSRPHVLTATSPTPPIITGLAAVGGTRRIQLTWNAVPIRDLKHYEVWRKIGGTLPGADPTVVSGAVFLRFSDATQVTDNDSTNLTPTTQGWYWVRAISTTDVEGPWAGPVGAVTTQLVTADIANAAIDATKFASSIKPVNVIADTSVSATDGTYAVPTSGTGAGLLHYRSGGAWVRVSNATDLSGQITAGQIANLAISAAAIQDNAVIARTIQDGAVAAAKLANAAVTPAALATALPSNWVWNPCGAISTDGWAAIGGSVAGSITVAATGDTTWSLTGQGSLVLRPTANLANNQYTEFAWRPSGVANDRSFPVRVGDRIAIQVECIAKNGVNARLLGYWYDASNVSTLAFYGAAQASTGVTDGNTLANYTRLTRITAAAPAGTVRFDLRIRLINESGATINTGDNPLLVVTRWGAGAAPANATEVPEWVPGAATELPGGMVRAGSLTNAQIADLAAIKITGTLTEAQIADLAITGPKIAAGAVTAAKITAGTITATEIAASTITGAKIAAATIAAANLAAGSVTAAKLAVGLPSNVIWNSTPGRTVDGWTAIAASGTTVNRQMLPVVGSSFDPDWLLPGTPGMVMRADSMNASAYLQTTWQPDAPAGSFACVPGDVVEIQALVLAQTGLDVIIYTRYRNAAGSEIGIGAYTVHNGTGPANGSSRANYTRIGGKSTAPANAVDCVLVVRLANSSGGVVTNGFGVLTQISIGLGMANATELSPWAPGGVTIISGGVVRTGSMDANRIIARSITADRIATGAITAVEIAANGITASRLFLGDTSNAYPDFDVRDVDFYSGAAFTLVATATASLGANYLRIAADASTRVVNSAWFGLEVGADYSVSGVACLLSAGATTAKLELELGTLDAAGVVTSSRVLTVQAATTQTTATRATLDITTTSTERRARWVMTKSNNAAAAVAFGGFLVRRRMTGSLIVDGTITGLKIAANTITAANVAAGTITGNEIAAQTITASRLAITGNSILPDGTFADTAFWSAFSPFVRDVNTGAAGTANTLGVPAALVLASPAYTGTGALAVTSIAFAPAEPSRWYYLRARGSNTNTTRALAVQIYAVDGANAQVGSAGFVSWTNQTASDKETKWQAPAGAVRLVMAVTVAAGSAWSGTAAVGNVSVVPAATGSMVVDGTITGNQIAGTTITASNIAGDTITAAQIAAGGIGASEIAANVINSGHLVTGSAVITGTAQIGTGVISSANIGNLQVQTANIADLTVGTAKIGYNAATRVAEVHAFTDSNYPGGRSPGVGQSSCYMNTSVQVETNGTVLIFMRVSLKATATGAGGGAVGGTGEGAS